MPRVVPRAKGRRPFRKGERVRATEGLYAEVNGEAYFVRTGMEFSSDHEIVRMCPNSFMPCDVAADEVIDWLQPPPEPAEHETTFPGVRRESREIEQGRAVVCIQPIGTLTRQAKLGQIYDVGDEIVRMAPGNFSWLRPVTQQDVEDAVGP